MAAALPFPEAVPVAAVPVAEPYAAVATTSTATAPPSQEMNEKKGYGEAQASASAPPYPPPQQEQPHYQQPPLQQQAAVAIPIGGPMTTPHGGRMIQTSRGPCMVAEEETPGCCQQVQ